MNWLQFWGWWYGVFGMTAQKKIFYVIKKFCPPKKFVNWRYWIQRPWIAVAFIFIIPPIFIPKKFKIPMEISKQLTTICHEWANRSDPALQVHRESRARVSWSDPTHKSIRNKQPESPAHLTRPRPVRLDPPALPPAGPFDSTHETIQTVDIPAYLYICHSAGRQYIRVSNSWYYSCQCQFTEESESQLYTYDIPSGQIGNVAFTTILYTLCDMIVSL